MSGTRRTQPEQAAASQPAQPPADQAGGGSPSKVVAPGSEESLELGYSGTAVDPTPNENYTLQGQLAGKPTPESADVKGFGEHQEPPVAAPKATDTTSTPAQDR